MQVGSPYNIPVSAQLSMPLFNAPYYVGVETVKLAQKLSATNLLSTEIDTRQSVCFCILPYPDFRRIVKDSKE